MGDFFKIYIDRLKNGGKEELSGSCSASFLHCQEKDLKFNHCVQVKATAYTTDDHLVIQLQASTKVSIPCSICNQMIITPLNIESFYLTKPLKDCTCAVYDFSQELREQIFLELPTYVECKGGCEERDFVKKFIKTQDPSANESSHFPFSELDGSEDVGDTYGRT